MCVSGGGGRGETQALATVTLGDKDRSHPPRESRRMPGRMQSMGDSDGGDSDGGDSDGGDSDGGVDGPCSRA